MSTETTKEQLYAQATEVRTEMRQYKPMSAEWQRLNSRLLSITVAIANIKRKE